jgi:hypothetical protein
MIPLILTLIELAEAFKTSIREIDSRPSDYNQDC